MDVFPLNAQNAYQDLLQLRQRRAHSELQGTPTLKTVKDKKYWYDQRRIGDKVQARYIGPDNETTRRQIKAAQSDKEATDSLDAQSAALVKTLRAAGLPTLDMQTGKVLSAMARAGTFRLGGTLIGTHAFRLYAAELGVPLPLGLGATEDIDISAFEQLSIAIEDAVDPSLAETFADLKLEPLPNLDPKGRSTRWGLSGGGTAIDFLTPRMQDRKTIVFLKSLGVYAEAISYLNFLIAEPIPAVGLYRSGVLVSIPAPERYAVHKLIVAESRSGPGRAKVQKDREQALWLIDNLREQRPDELKAAYEIARAKGPKWRETLTNAVSRTPGLEDRLTAGG